MKRLSKFLLNADKGSKSMSDAPAKTLTYTGEAFSALLSNENVLNNRPLVGAYNLRPSHQMSGAANFVSLDYIIDSMSKIIQDRFKKVEDELLEEKVGRVFLSLPNDCLTRPQREHLLEILLGRIQAVSDSADVSPAQWKLVLAFLTKIMKRPTFREVCLTRPSVLSDEAHAFINRVIGTRIWRSGDDCREGVKLFRDGFGGPKLG